jgi:hypothetical protein
MLFQKVEDCQTILFSGGVYRQTDVYVRQVKDEQNLYAKYGGGYVRLLSANGTSHPKITWQYIEEPIGKKLDFSQRFGRPRFVPL